MAGVRRAALIDVKAQKRRPVKSGSMSGTATTLFVIAIGLSLVADSQAAEISTDSILFRVSDSGAYEIVDKAAGVTWRSESSSFGEVTLNRSGRPERIALLRPTVHATSDALTLEFHPLTNEPGAVRVVVTKLQDPRALKFGYAADISLQLENIRLLDQMLSTTGDGYVVVPVREGLLVPANSGLSFTQRFETYAYEGCHLAMFGVVKEGAAVLVTWDDPYETLELRSTLATKRNQVLAPSLALRKSANSFRIQLLGKGDYVTIANAYREVAKEKGLLVTWDQKLKQNPDRAKYFGASNYKLWSTLDRRMNDESTKEERVRVNWTFAETAQVAEHLKHDLKLDKVLFIMGGWIHRGYDNQHPDILPTAPECGGDTPFSDACKRIRSLGYLLSLHDNYQDIYHDSPSWNERWIQKNADGLLTKGGHWAGGRAYITCSKMALELAQRPQNLAAVKKLSNADSYFIDTTYAAGLQECFDKEHPLSRVDDMRWKQALSDYAREVFGSFGSECGREWAIPHADFFEGLTGVSGKYYHNLDPAKFGAAVIPLFELVYRDCIAMYGKYGYDPAQAAEYVLHHIAMGRPLNYHNVPSHLYWKEPSRGAESLSLRPSVAEFKQTAPRQFTITYEWQVEKPVTDDWRVFVHFTEPGSGGADKIKFQNDHAPTTAVPQWKLGVVRERPLTVTVPDNLSGTFAVRMGLYQSPGGERALLATGDRGSRSCVVGRLTITGEKISFEATPPARTKSVGDTALFTRAEHGWAEGMHVLDRFVKNTHEILSPLNEITARTPMTKHEFLTPDRKVQHSVFGTEGDVVDVIVNCSAGEFRCNRKLGGETVLPPYGFAIESATFAAFCAVKWNGQRYAEPVLFTMRTEDGTPLASSKRVRVFHAFGDDRVRIRDQLHRVRQEAIVSN